MTHVVLIAVHAIAAVVAFGFGCALMVRPPERSTSVRLVIYTSSVVIAVLALSTVVAIDFMKLAPVKQIAFSTLVVLAIVLVVRSVLAVRAVAVRADRWVPRFLGHIGFVLISLFDGFCIVLAIDLRMPAYVVAGAAVLGVAVGILATRAAVRHAGGAPTFSRREKQA